MNIPSLDPELLRAFVVVADRLSFTRAAEQLNRTQAAVSLQAKRLEERLDTALFRRSTARVELTAAGEGFLTDARRILALNEQAIARVSNRVAGHVRIGVMEDYGTRILPSLLADIAERFPLVQVDMEIGLTALLLKRLGSSFDAVIAMHPEGTTEGDLICRERAIWAAASTRAVEELDPLPVALSYPDCLFRAWAIDALDKAGRPWRLALCQPEPRRHGGNRRAGPGDHRGQRQHAGAWPARYQSRPLCAAIARGGDTPSSRRNVFRQRGIGRRSSCTPPQAIGPGLIGL